MFSKQQMQHAIQVCAHWQGMENPVATGGGLSLNITINDNSQSLDLARSFTSVFRVKREKAEEIIAESCSMHSERRSHETRQLN